MWFGMGPAPIHQESSQGFSCSIVQCSQVCLLHKNLKVSFDPYAEVRTRIAYKEAKGYLMAHCFPILVSVYPPLFSQVMLNGSPIYNVGICVFTASGAKSGGLMKVAMPEVCELVIVTMQVNICQMATR